MTGTWPEETGSPLVSMVIGGVAYEGTFVSQTMEGSNVETLCFTAVGNNDICLWGAKYQDNRTAASIGNDGYSYRNYVNIVMDAPVSANGSAATDFGDSVAGLDDYVVELDTMLCSGNVAQHSISEFAIIGTDCNAVVTITSDGTELYSGESGY